mgnify:CR=1 FL=1
MNSFFYIKSNITNIRDFKFRMKIKSTYFKREFDIQKAELIGKGTFAQVTLI